MRSTSTRRSKEQHPAGETVEHTARIAEISPKEDAMNSPQSHDGQRRYLIVCDADGRTYRISDVDLSRYEARGKDAPMSTDENKAIMQRFIDTVFNVTGVVDADRSGQTYDAPIPPDD